LVLDYKIKKKVILTVYQTSMHTYVKSNRGESTHRAEQCMWALYQYLCQQWRKQCSYYEMHPITFKTKLKLSNAKQAGKQMK
jgi:hypothetical protein